MDPSLDPPDRTRCQAEKPNGYTAFTLGAALAWNVARTCQPSS